MAPPYAWAHKDPAGLNSAVSAALLAAQQPKGLWGLTSYDRIAAHRALLAATYFEACELPYSFKQNIRDVAGVGQTSLLPTLQRGYYSAEEWDVATALWRPWDLLYRYTARTREYPFTLDDGSESARGPRLPARQILTIGGDPAVPLTATMETEAGAIITPAVAIVGIVALAGVACYLGGMAMEVYDRADARQTEVTAMLAAQANMIALAAKHRAAEDAAGKDLPLDEAEKAALTALKEATKATGRAFTRDLPGIFPDFKGETKKVIDTAGALGSQTIMVIGALGLVYLLLTKG